MTTNKIIVSIVVALILGFGVGYLIHSNSATEGGFTAPHIEVAPWSFANGAGFGQTNQSYFDKTGLGYLDGVVNGGKASIVTIDNGSTGSLTLTAAQICADNVIIATNTKTSIGTYTLPTTTLLTANCLPDAGKWLDVNIFNTATTTLTIAAGTGGTLGNTSAATIATGKYGILRIINDTATSYKAFLINIVN